MTYEEVSKITDEETRRLLICNGLSEDFIDSIPRQYSICNMSSQDLIDNGLSEDLIEDLIEDVNKPITDKEIHKFLRECGYITTSDFKLIRLPDDVEISEEEFEKFKKCVEENNLVTMNDIYKYMSRNIFDEWFCSKED